MEQGLTAALAKRIKKQLKNPVVIRVKKQDNSIEKFKNVC